MLASQKPRDGRSPARATAATAVAAGSRPTTTALCAEVSSRRASAVKSGKPNTTPRATSPSRRNCERDGRGPRRSTSSSAAGMAASASRPMPTKVGSSSSTATRVAGSVKLKASTPRKPRNSAIGA